MKKIVMAFLLVGVSFLCLGPASAASKAEQDIEELKRRLETVEQATIGKGTNRLKTIEERQDVTTRGVAEVQAELDALRVEFQKLRGSFDDLVHTRKELHDLINMMRAEMELKFGAMDDKLAKLKNVQTLATSKEAAPDPSAEYQAALALVQKDGEFAKGRKALQEFLKKYPDHELVVNASYWIGEAYYGEKKYENAILQFQDVLQKHPQHTKAAAAQLKQALAFQSLGDKETAQVLLRKVVNNYPEAPEAKKAEEMLNKKR